MPSSGKSTVGKILAESLGFDFADTDEMIANKHSMSILSIFSVYGEKMFRQWESECVEEISKKSGYVIATGGGAILDEKNACNLKKNGRLYFLDRPLDSLMPTSNRPLSSDRDALEKRFAERYDKYKSACDFEIISDSTAEMAVNKIMEK